MVYRMISPPPITKGPSLKKCDLLKGLWYDAIRLYKKTCLHQSSHEMTGLMVLDLNILQIHM